MQSILNMLVVYINYINAYAPAFFTSANMHHIHCVRLMCSIHNMQSTRGTHIRYIYIYIYIYIYSQFGWIGALGVMYVPNHPNGAFLKHCKKGGAWCLINDFV